MSFDTIFALNGIITLAVMVMCFISYFLLCSLDRRACRAANTLGVLGIFYAMMVIIYGAWTFGLLPFTEQDFIIMNTTLTIVTSSILLYTIFILTNEKRLLYVLFIFCASIVAINFSLASFYPITLIASDLINIIVFLELIISPHITLKKAGYAGICYAVSLGVFTAFLFSSSSISTGRLPWFIPQTFFFLVLFFIHTDIRTAGIHPQKNDVPFRQNSIIAYILTFLKFAVYISALLSFGILSTIALHEMGHALVAQYYGCSHVRAVVYDIINPPHTEIICQNQYNDTFISLGGVIATTIIGLLLFASGNAFIQGIAFFIAGVGFLIGYSDLKGIGTSGNVLAIVIIISALATALTVIKISSEFLLSQEIFKVEPAQNVKIPLKKIARLKQNRGLEP